MSINGAQEGVVRTAQVAVAGQAVLIMRSRLRALVAPARLKLLIVRSIIWIALVWSCLMNSCWHPTLIVVWAGIELIERWLGVLLVVVSAIPIDHAVRYVPKLTHLVGLVLQDARRVRETLHRVSLEGARRVLKWRGVFIRIYLRISLVVVAADGRFLMLGECH